MFSLQRLVGGDGEFFTLLEASAEQSVLGAQALLELLPEPGGARPLDRLGGIKRKNNTLTDEIFRLLCRSFVTPLDREDLEKLATALHKIPKTLEKFTEQWEASQAVLGRMDFSRQLRIIAQAADIIVQMVKDLPHSPEVATVKAQIDQLRRLEGEADKLLLELLKDLFSGRHGPVEALALSGLYELLEKAVDRCRDAGNLLFLMALKLS